MALVDGYVYLVGSRSPYVALLRHWCFTADRTGRSIFQAGSWPRFSALLERQSGSGGSTNIHCSLQRLCPPENNNSCFSLTYDLVGPTFDLTEVIQHEREGEIEKKTDAINDRAWWCA